jgi:hypothetical protein
MLPFPFATNVNRNDQKINKDLSAKLKAVLDQPGPVAGPSVSSRLAQTLSLENAQTNTTNISLSHELVQSNHLNQTLQLENAELFGTCAALQGEIDRLQALLVAGQQNIHRVQGTSIPNVCR